MSQCFLCGSKDSQLLCRHCQKTTACSEDCMKIHCPDNITTTTISEVENSNSNSCNAFRMQQNESVGRYLVASRKIQPQEVVLIDPALVIAPQSLPVCLVCLGKCLLRFELFSNVLKFLSETISVLMQILFPKSKEG